MEFVRSTILFGILAGCISAVQAQGGNSQPSSVTIYGVLDAGVEWARSGTGDRMRLVSGGAQGSRLGFRGNEDLGNGISASFRLEQGINIDDGTLGQGGRAFGREASVGLGSNTLGTVMLGRLPTPYYLAAGAVDAFAWMGGGLLALTRSAESTQQIFPLGIGARYDNAMGYVAPRLGPISLRAVVAAREGSTSLGRAYSLSGRYQNGPADLVLAWARQDGAGIGTGRIDAVVAGGNYDFGGVRLFAGYTAEENNCTTCTAGLARGAGTSSSEFRVVNVGARIPVAGFTAIVQATRLLDRSAYAVAPGSRDASWLAVGAEYALSRRTLAYASISSVNNQNGSQYVIGSGTAQQPPSFAGKNNARSSSVTFGMRHTF